MMQEFVQEVEEMSEAALENVHTALPGTIVSFNAEAGTATVEPKGKYEMADGSAVSYPQISEVPIVFPFCQSRNAGFVFPVGKGDDCLVIISEVELDEWRSGAEAEGSLRFDLSSAICIPGLLRGGAGAVVKARKNNAVIMRSGNSEIMLEDKKAALSVGNTKMTLSEAGVVVSGNLKVNGNISST